MVEFEVEAKYHRGGTRWIHVVYTPHRDSENRVLGIVVLVSDISQRKRAEEELQRAQEELRNMRLPWRRRWPNEQLNCGSSGRIESFSYSIAHDMRAPLRSMRGYAEILEREHREKLDDEARDYLRRIGASAERLDALIRDVLNYSKVVRGDTPLESVSTENSFVTSLIPTLISSRRGRRYWCKHLCQSRGQSSALTQVIANC